MGLDDAWNNCDWSGPLRTQIEKYYVLPFHDWKNDSAFDVQFDKLVEGIQAFYPRPTRHE